MCRVTMENDQSSPVKDVLRPCGEKYFFEFFKFFQKERKYFWGFLKMKEIKYFWDFLKIFLDFSKK